VSFLAAGRARQDLVAGARVIRRGKTLSVIDVEVKDAAASVSRAALVTYKLG
jgi:acyl-coenzyme A thioesterase PaaI-like protein